MTLTVERLNGDSDFELRYPYVVRFKAGDCIDKEIDMNHWCIENVDNEFWYKLWESDGHLLWLFTFEEDAVQFLITWR